MSVTRVLNLCYLLLPPNSKFDLERVSFFFCCWSACSFLFCLRFALGGGDSGSTEIGCRCRREQEGGGRPCVASLQGRLGNREVENYAARAYPLSLWFEYEWLFFCLTLFLSFLSFRYFRSFYLPLLIFLLRVDTDSDAPQLPKVYAAHDMMMRERASTRERDREGSLVFSQSRCVFLPLFVCLCPIPGKTNSSFSYFFFLCFLFSFALLLDAVSFLAPACLFLLCYSYYSCPGTLTFSFVLPPLNCDYLFWIPLLFYSQSCVTT